MREPFEKTFAVRAPVERAWNAFTDPNELEVWFAARFERTGDDAPFEAETPGGPVGFDLLEFDLHHKLRYRQWAASPDRGIDVTIVFESEATGTRITWTASGFGGDTIFESDSVRRGIVEALADLALYLDHGIVFPRHRDIRARNFLGVQLRETFAGAVVEQVHPGSTAERAGLRAGDLLLQVGRGAVFTNAELAFFQREHDAGEDVELVWARDGELKRAVATLDASEGPSFAVYA